MQSGVTRVRLVVLGELRVQLAVHRIGFPGVARRTGLRELGQPHVQTLMRRVGTQQPMQRSGPGAHQSGDEDRPLDDHVGVLRVLLPGRLGQQPCHQRSPQEEPIHLAAQHRETGFAFIRVQQDAQRFAVIVVVTAKVVEAHQLGGRCVQVFDGAYISSISHYVWYSPQLTSKVCPVIPLERSLAKNRIAEATSSSVGNRLRSEFAAVAW